VLQITPAKPRFLASLPLINVANKTEVDISENEIHDANFSKTQRLDVEGCKLDRINLNAKLDKFSISDSLLRHIEGVGLRSYKPSFLRVVMEGSRFTGADFGAGSFEDCTFKNVKFDEAGFRFTHFKRVRFEQCVLHEADFSEAKFTHASFEGCDLELTNFDKAVCKYVDLRGENLTSVKGILGLKGATITNEQLIHIAPMLAAELDFTVNDEV
jgi:Pentapeptide repeats (9 copies)